MAHIVVTGGTGYIGSHTVVELAASGHRVSIIDNLSNSHLSVLHRLEKICGKKPGFAQLDLCHSQLLNQWFETCEKVDAIIHFAACKAVGESVQNPLKYYQNNLSGLTNLLLAMQAHSCQKLVFSSSCSVYGNATQLPVTETAPLMKAESPYGNTKLIGEDILTDVCKTGWLQAISLRYFNPVGAHPSALIGELPIGTPSNLVPLITQVAAGLRPSLTVHGTDYPTADGTCIRDYIHVLDLARAHVAAVNRLLENKNSAEAEIFNLGTGQGSSVMQAIAAFEESTGQKLPWQSGPRRPGDVVAIWSDCTKSREVLGFETEFTLHDAMLSAWKWQQELVK